MLTIKNYATDDDLKLLKCGLVSILSLNDCLPQLIGKIWVTKKEIAERLIHCGVDSSLDMMQLDTLVANYNNGGHLDKRKFNHKTYFRHSIYDTGSPKDQHEGVRNIMPPKNYFKRLLSAKGILKVLNNKLKQVHAVKDSIKKGEISSKTMCLLYSILCTCFWLIVLGRWMVRLGKREGLREIFCNNFCYNSNTSA